MNTNNLPKHDFTIVFDKARQYNEANLLSKEDFLKPEEIIASEEIRDFMQICSELNDNSQGTVIYRTFY
jgi:hypothetical protein